LSAALAVQEVHGDDPEGKAGPGVPSVSNSSKQLMTAVSQMRERLVAMGMLNSNRVVVESDQPQGEASEVPANSPRRNIRLELRRRVNARAEAGGLDEDTDTEEEVEDALPHLILHFHSLFLTSTGGGRGCTSAVSSAVSQARIARNPVEIRLSLRSDAYGCAAG
jgi:Fe2+ transport system protein FeoA